MSIGQTHPLRRLFTGLVARDVPGDPGIKTYITNLLTDFVPTDRLYGVRNASGKRLSQVAEMLLESNPLLDAPSFEREREVRKHIGDYTLFMTGMFPEFVASLPRRGHRLDSFIDYVKAGKESYRIVGAFDQFEYRQAAPLFRRLSECFEYCVHGLNLVKHDLETLRDEGYQVWRRDLLGP